MPAGRPYDLMVVGGGINGAGIARDAAGRGLSVVLCEQGDLASATSSASSKLIHGGLRYLENHDFRLVREALGERDVLLEAAPHIVQPLRFVLPHRAGQRARWLIRTGLFLYDRLGGSRTLPASRAVDLRRDPGGIPLKPGLTKGFSYYDCRVDDARLVILNARDAADKGAEILTRTKLAGARRANGLWEVGLEPTDGGARRTLSARALVNATGPWAQRLRDGVLGQDDQSAGHGTERASVRLVRGSHIVVPRIHHGEDAYILQNDDGRVVFVLPFEGAFSLLGTTEVTTDGEPGDVRMDNSEAEYICAAVNRYFGVQIRPDQAVWSFAGLRALVDDSAEEPGSVTRDYRIELDVGPDEAPLLSVLGGKITTYRRLAEQAMAGLRPRFPDMKGNWTQGARLPGGNLGGLDMKDFVEDLANNYPDMAPEWLSALAHRHGGLSRDVLGDASRSADMGTHFGAGLYAREIDYLHRREWARTAEDILWRRTKFGLRMTAEEREAFRVHLDERELVG